MRTLKHADRHQYLQYLPVHPYQTKNSVAFSQALSISRLCSSEKDFENHKEKKKSRFKNREYPDNLISSKMRKVKFSKLKTALFSAYSNPPRYTVEGTAPCNLRRRHQWLAGLKGLSNM